MTVVYELPREEVALQGGVSFEDLQEAERSLVTKGTDTTRALFVAAQMVLRLRHGHAAISRPDGQQNLLSVIKSLSYDHVVIAGATPSVDDIQGVGVYRFDREKPSTHTAKIADLYVNERDRNNGIGALIVNHIEHAAEAEGAEFIEVLSSFAAIPFYARSFYEAQSHTTNGLYKRLR